MKVGQEVYIVPYDSRYNPFYIMCRKTHRSLACGAELRYKYNNYF